MLLHPFPLDAGFWEPARRALGDARPALVPEFPGFGAAPPQRGAGVDGFADAVAARISDASPTGRAVVAGCSLGGYVALSLAARHPERVAALVLADTRAEPDTAEAAAGRARTAERVLAEGTAAWLDEFVPGAVAPDADDAARAVRAIAGRQSPEAVAGALAALAGRADRRPDLPRIAAPALVLVGAQDALTPPAMAEALAAGLPDAELVVLPGAGHLAPLERPEEFAAAVRGFLVRRLP